MPLIRVTLPQGAWSTEQKAQLAEKLTDGLVSVAATAGKGDVRQFTTLHVLETSEGGYAIGGSVVG